MIRMADTEFNSMGDSPGIESAVSLVAIRCSASCLLLAAAWMALDLQASLATAAAGTERQADGLRIDPARATAAELELIPGIGPSTAGRIVQHRLDVGDASLCREDADGASQWSLDVVRGVGPITVRRAAPYLVRTSGGGDPRRPAVRP
jgi:hypothetical protein